MIERDLILEPSGVVEVSFDEFCARSFIPSMQQEIDQIESATPMEAVTQTIIPDGQVNFAREHHSRDVMGHGSVVFLGRLVASFSYRKSGLRVQRGEGCYIARDQGARIMTFNKRSGAGPEYYNGDIVSLEDNSQDPSLWDVKMASREPNSTIDSLP